MVSVWAWAAGTDGLMRMANAQAMRVAVRLENIEEASE
jgi:hypothetical protein